MAYDQHFDAPLTAWAVGERSERRVTRSPAAPGGTLVLDSEGLAKAVLRDRPVIAGSPSPAPTAYA